MIDALSGRCVDMVCSTTARGSRCARVEVRQGSARPWLRLEELQGPCVSIVDYKKSTC